MPLQQLVEYFNDRFGLEHKSSFRPILLDNGIASGLFGPVRINSHFLPLHQPDQPEIIRGYAAKLGVSPYDPLLLQHQQIESLLANSDDHSINFDSIINFDRLARTVHLLNYLPISHLEQTLFIDVDPRHILSVKNAHGAYFEEVITKCGLQAGNVVLVTGINTYFAQHFEALQNGLNNYRLRGYQIGLRFNFLNKDSFLLNTINQLSPNYVCLSGANIDSQLYPENLLVHLAAIKAKVNALNGEMVLLDVTEQKLAQSALEANIELVGGNYYSIAQGN